MAQIKKYQFLEHLSDLKIKAFGKTKKELFLNMFLGMMAGLRPKREAQDEKRKIKIVSLDLNALLVDFLSEALYLAQVNREVYGSVKFIKFSDTEIEAELLGQKVKRFGEEIKAVTYHKLDIHQKGDETWEATLLFDI